MHVVLIGGAGFVGHHAAVELVKRGHRVTVVDSLMINNYYMFMESGKEVYLRFAEERLEMLRKAGVPVLRVDARDYGMMNAVVNPLRPDAIVHLAAIAHIDRANKDPYSTFDHNLRTLENTLDVARSMKANPHVVYFSSSTVYGNFSSPVLDEKSPCHPFGIYGALKLAGEHIVRAYQNVYGMDCTIIRPCALYGPRCVSGRVGQKFLEAALRGGPITVFGDGEIHEDFTFIDDLVDGMVLVLEKREKATGETFNITAGCAHSLNTLAYIVSREFNVEVVHGEADPEKPHRGTMRVDKATRVLGYEPRHTLERGMEKYIAWYRSRMVS